ncbi:MAG: hypothetical protein HY842_15600 [Bacteroidetes bacterium]|nr:hypothetical protein [Bacteroidota bacterium]
MTKAFPLLIVLSLSLAACRREPLPAPHTAEVKPWQGRPALFLDGQPEAPVFYALTDVPGGRWSWEEVPQHNLRNFCGAGIRLFQLDIFLEQLWTAPDTFRLDLAQRQIRGVLEVCPQAAVVFRFHLNPPAWWLVQHPAEQVAYESDTLAEPFKPLHLSRLVQDDSRLPVRASLASEIWRTDAAAKLAAFCRGFSQTPEGRALIGIHVASGVYGEWHQWGFIEHEADFSAPMRAFFSKWLREKYATPEALRRSWGDPQATFETIRIPTPEERNIASSSLFRNPKSEIRNPKCVDYYQCQHQLVADDLLFFCKTVKENWPRPVLTGAFYGYFFSMFNRQAAGGHLALQQVLASPYIDYLSGPQVYYPDDGYDPGEPYRSRSLTRSVALHGKLWLDEYDQQPRRTFPLLNGQDNSENYQRNVQENIAAIRRNMLSPLTKGGAGLWFYDFGPGGMNLHRQNEHDIQSGTIGYWDHPDYLKNIKALKTLADAQLQRLWQTQSDVLLVCDTEVFYHLKSTRQDSCPITSQVVDWLPLALHYSGVAFDAVHLDDLGQLDFSPYKAVIFANTWLLGEADRKAIRERAARDDRHLFWIYAPGFTDGETLNPAAVSEITGLQLAPVFYEKTPVAVPVAGLSGLPRQSAWGILDPLFSVKDAAAQPLATFAHDRRLVAFAKKKMEDYTAIYLALPPIDAAWWRHLLHDAGVHIFTEDEGVVYAGGGLLVFHTKTGGQKRLVLKNGKEVLLQMPEGAGTVVLDSQSGEVL